MTNEKTKLRYLIVDGQAVLYKYFFGYIKEKIEDIIAISHVNMLHKIQYLVKKYNIDNVVVAFDCENKSWRKLYTSDKNPDKITHRKYKDGRREGLTSSELKKLTEFDPNIKEYVTFFKQQTSILCLQGNYLEADDLIAGFVQKHPNDDHIIYSADKDFLQLIGSINGDVILVESQKDLERSLDKWNNDPKLFLFEKCFRGEPRGGDNIQNAFPRLLRTKILRAYTDNFLFNNLMNNTFEVSDIDQDGNPIYYKYTTLDLFNENKLLMGLDNQPEHIKNLINETINEGIQSIGQFDYVAFLRFCKTHGMDNIINEKNNFIKILSNRYTTLSSSVGS